MPATPKQKGPTRAEKARQTRTRMLDAARERFIDEGYAATTMQQIANEAGVAVQTLYWSFRTKGQLLREVIETTAAGEEDAPPVPERPRILRRACSRSPWSTAPTSTSGWRRSCPPFVPPQRPIPSWPSIGRGSTRVEEPDKRVSSPAWPSSAP